MKTKLIIFIISFFVSTVAITFAQQPVADTSSPPGLTVNLENLNCFKSLHCIKKNDLFVKSNIEIFNMANSRFEGYTLEGSAESEELFAQYDYQGDLIRSTVIQRNIPLPKEIRSQLSSEEFNSWRMIGNERLIQNFEGKSIEYKVILQKDDNTRIVYFDHKGQNKNLLS